MPLLERVCWNCNLPVSADNIYKLKTLCQCTRCVHCKQMSDDMCDPTCVTQLPPPVIPVSVEWIDMAQERLRTIEVQVAAPQRVETPVPMAQPMPTVTSYTEEARLVLGHG
jgi:hypothetical protein